MADASSRPLRAVGPGSFLASRLASITLLEARYKDGFLACGPPPRTAPTIPVAARNALQTQRGSGYAELVWAPTHATEIGGEMRAQAGTPGNDVNSDFAKTFVVLGLPARQRYQLAPGVHLDLLARVDNVTERVYADSVIVNEGTGRFFEAGGAADLADWVRVGQML